MYRRGLFGCGVYRRSCSDVVCMQKELFGCSVQKGLYGCGYSLAGMQFAGYNVLNVQC